MAAEYVFKNAYLDYARELPVSTTFPDTKISSTIRGFTMRYIKPGNNSGS